MITYNVEKFSDVIDEAQGLIVNHYMEIALHKDRVPLSPKYDDYKKLEDAGVLLIYTVRDDNKLIGYLSAIVATRLHNGTVLNATTDIIYIAPEYRNAGVGNGLFDYVENSLSQLGVQAFQCNSKIQHPALKFLLNSRGYEDIEIVHNKFLKG